jgi:hypothetical protein
MKKIQKTMAAMIMVAVLMVGTTFANGGILLSDLAGNNQNTCNQSKDGILVVGFTGILVVGFTGILVIGLTGSEDGTRNQTQCRDGILLSD